MKGAKIFGDCFGGTSFELEVLVIKRMGIVEDAKVG